MLYTVPASASASPSPLYRDHWRTPFRRKSSRGKQWLLSGGTVRGVVGLGLNLYPINSCPTVGQFHFAGTVRCRKRTSSLQHTARNLLMHDSTEVTVLAEGGVHTRGGEISHCSGAGSGRGASTRRGPPPVCCVRAGLCGGAPDLLVQ